jgi:glycosyltransferase involved in cell wall biosynthesis
VIGTMTGGSAELFRHEENALTYKAGDAAEMAGCILSLATNDSMRERITRTGHEEVRHRFAEPIIVEQIEDYLQETVRDWPRTLPLHATAA